jgi:Na+-transporting methylmalonyl-CoA/oxaloacetate decarboxylase gamma subunit
VAAARSISFLFLFVDFVEGRSAVENLFFKSDNEPDEIENATHNTFATLT